MSKNTCYSTNPKTGKHTCETKNGKPRYIIIHKDNEAFVRAFINDSSSVHKVCDKVPDSLSIHGIRGLFFAIEYHRDAADINSIRNEKVPSQRNKNVLVSRVYKTRDGTGREFDRLALRKVSKQLEHNREDVVAKHYLCAFINVIAEYKFNHKKLFH